MKIFITYDCAVPAIDGTAHCAANSVQDVDADTARAVVQAGKALYVDPKDDPSRSKARTAPETMVEAVRQAMKRDKKAEA